MVYGQTLLYAIQYTLFIFECVPECFSPFEMVPDFGKIRNFTRLSIIPCN